MNNTTKPASVSEYISSLPAESQAKFTELWNFLKKSLPQTQEEITYNMPTLKLDGKFLVSSAAFKNHVSLFPFPAGDEELEKEAAAGGFDTSGKGTIQFPYDKPYPFELIEKIVARTLQDHAKNGNNY